MKRYYYLLLTSLIAFGCGTKEPIPSEPKMLEVSLSFVLPESGSMTKATAAEVYDSFYEKYMKTGELLPKPYSLTFSTMDDVQVANIAGRWDSNKPVMLATGKYHVTGASNGGTSSSAKYLTPPLLFDEVIEINENTSSITLHATYDCFLLLFDAAGKTYFRWSADGSGKSDISGDVGKVDDLCYIFVQGFQPNGNIQWNYDGKENRIWMQHFNFQKGYYYYYNDLSGSFEIPKMQAGSI